MIINVKKSATQMIKRTTKVKWRFIIGGKRWQIVMQIRYSTRKYKQRLIAKAVADPKTWKNAGAPEGDGTMTSRQG